jgi:hypothetical protein
MSIDESGVRLDIQGDVSVMFQGKKKLHDIVHANARLDITVSVFSAVCLSSSSSSSTWCR